MNSTYLYTLKRIILILLISFYTAATFGFSVKQFYCCNKLKSTTISITLNADKKCGMVGNMGNCCKTTYQFFKVKDTHFGQNGFSGLAKDYSPIEFFQPFFVDILQATPIITVANYGNPPPLHNGIPIYRFDCVYRI